MKLLSMPRPGLAGLALAFPLHARTRALCLLSVFVSVSLDLAILRCQPREKGEMHRGCSKECGLVYSPDSGQAEVPASILTAFMFFKHFTQRAPNRAPEASDPVSIYPVLKWF